MSSMLRRTSILGPSRSGCILRVLDRPALELGLGCSRFGLGQVPAGQVRARVRVGSSQGLRVQCQDSGLGPRGGLLGALQDTHDCDRHS